MNVRNKKIHLEFDVEKEFEAGLVLFGDEVKSIRKAYPNINESYGFDENNEIFVKNLLLKYAKQENRNKKLLLNISEIKKIKEYLCRKFIIVISEMYEKNGKFKIKICICKKRKLFDKRRAIKEKRNEK